MEFKARELNWAVSSAIHWEMATREISVKDELKESESWLLEDHSENRMTGS